MRIICIAGDDAQVRLDCATRTGRALLSAGRTAALVSQWNRSGDPDPYQSTPFSELALISAEASLSYIRPGMKLDAVLSSMRSDWLIADGIDMPGAPRIACSPDAVDETTVAVSGFDMEGGGIPSLPTSDSALAAFLLEKADLPYPGSAAVRAGEPGEASNVTVRINGSLLELGGFPARVLESTVEGLLSAFRGYDPTGDLEIAIHR